MYPSDITREQFETVRPMLEATRKKTKPRTLDIYDIFNGLLYVLSTGCQWRALPKEYPKFGTVHKYFRIWTGEDSTLWSEVLKKIGRRRAYEKWQKMQNDHGYR